MGHSIKGENHLNKKEKSEKNRERESERNKKN